MEPLVRVPGGVVGTLSPLILRTRHLPEMLGVDAVIPLNPLRKVDAVVGWGRKRNADWASRYARLRGVPFFRLEDGFLRSVGLGSEGFPPLSVVVDDLGIYYDATVESRLERLLVSDDPRLEDPAWLDRASALRSTMRRFGLSKYNAARGEFDAPGRGGGTVLVVDQVAGDLSLRFGGVGAQTSRDMLKAALRENPGANILVKPHPQGALSALGGASDDPRVQYVPPGAHPTRLLEQVDRVYVMTSLLGFEALLSGTRVSVFGSPFYAGWGLTDDRAPLARRGVQRSLDQLVVAAYLLYPRYWLPEVGCCTAEDVAAYLASAVGRDTGGRR